ncbi:hypothetical protein ABID19_000015 [Mesorhizobium robiniae]|uniref:Helicase n=1 Tax=Mesorhizobium robiniae TaxID=559315 RepID=A0ABV2GFB6_9HYPH
MKKYVAAALTIGIAIGPASALDAGLGGKAGGLGLGAGVSVGSQGASVGVGTSVGGLGVDAGVSAGSQGASVGVGTSVGGLGVDAGVSAGSQGASVGVGTSVGGLGVDAGVSAGSQSASVGVGTTVDGASGANVGASVGAGNVSVGAGVSASGSPSTVGDHPSAENGSATAPGSPAAITTATASAKTNRQRMALPPVLRPSKAGEGGSTRGYPLGSLGPLKSKPGTPAQVVRACRAAIKSAATPLGAVSVHAVSAGVLRQRRGALTAPIEVRIDYARQGGIEVRRARVGCRLNTAGRVTAIK